MRGQGSDCVRCTREISPPAGGDLLFPWRKRRQNATGDASDGLRLRFAPPRSIGLLSPDPYYGSYPLSQTKNFRRAKSEWLSAISSGPLGPGFLENWSWCDSTTAPGVAEPTCLVRNTGYLIRPLRGHLPLKGKAGGCHFKAFPFRGRWLAEGQTDEAGGQRPPAGRRGRRPLRQNRKIPPSRRGGCPHPPAPEDSSHS